MNNSSEIRLDKWLWSVRLFKTRAIASDYCKKGKVIINGSESKPSKVINLDDDVEIKNNGIIYKYKVKGLIKNRVSAKLAVENYLNLTSKEELDKLLIQKTTVFYREKGLGRPTKKDRRNLSKITNYKF